jgi:hypothetical protein
MEPNTYDNVKRPAPILTRDNYRSWFQIMRDFLEGEGVYWTVENQTTPLSTPDTSSQAGSLDSMNYSQHNPQWRKDNGKARYNIILCLDQDDKDEVEELRAASKVWEYLKDKYNKKFSADAMAYIQQYVNFRMQDGQGIRSAWVHLTNLGRQIAEIDPTEKAYKEPSKRIKHLLAALPPAYRSTRSTINAQVGLTPEQILLLLESQEAEFNQESQDTAMYTGRPKPQEYKNYQHTQKPPTCLICDSNHKVIDCPELPAVQKSFRKKSDRKQERVQPSRKRRSSPENNDLKALIKKLTIEVNALKKGQSSKRQEAYSAQEGTPDISQPYSPESPSPSDGEEYEVAAAAPNAKGKLLPDQWLLDSGASAHMTDNPSCFRGPLIPLRRRWIKVGGGYLWSDSYRKAVIGDKSQNWIELDVLLIPGLGVNLISGKKLCAEYNLYSLMKPDSFTIVLSYFIP